MVVGFWEGFLVGFVIALLIILFILWLEEEKSFKHSNTNKKEQKNG